MKIVEVNVITHQERTLMTGVPSAKAEQFRKHFIGRLYDTNRYSDYIIEVKP